MEGVHIVCGMLCLVLFAQSLDCKSLPTEDNQRNHVKKDDNRTPDTAMKPTVSSTTTADTDNTKSRTELETRCKDVTDLATDVAHKAEEAFNITCQFTPSVYFGQYSCLEHTLRWREEYSNFSHLELVNTTIDNNTTMMTALYRGVAAHYELMKMVYCTSDNLECGGTMRGCNSSLPRGVHVDRQPREYCSRTETLLEVYTKLKSLKINLPDLPFFVNISKPKPEDLKPHLDWQDTEDRVSYYLTSIYNTYQQATHTKDIVNQLCQEHSVEAQPQVVVQ